MSDATSEPKAEPVVAPPTEDKPDDASAAAEQDKTFANGQDEAVAAATPEEPVKTDVDAGADASANKEATVTTDAAAETTKENKTPAAILKTTRQSHPDHRKNRKFDASVLPDSNDPTEIRQQVEYYFGDDSYPRDKNLWTKCQGTKNVPFPLKELLLFNRMRRFKDRATVVAALRESEFLVVSGEAGDEHVSRKEAYVLGSQEDKLKASVYVKGFGDEKPSTQFDLERFFGNLGDVKQVKLRRTDQKLFKGSVFVLFSSPEEMEKFLALDPKPQWEGNDLLIMSKAAYCEGKSKGIEDGTVQPSKTFVPTFFEGRVSKSSYHKNHGDGNHKTRGSGDRDRGRGRGRGNGRGGYGGRGGGRGGFGRGRGGRGGRGRDNSYRGRAAAPSKPSNGNDVKPVVHSSAPADVASNGKRARDDGGAGAGEPAAKKVATGAS